MVKINEIRRTSTFAWSSDSLPLLATGTVAGAVDVNFDSSSSLDIWDSFLNKEEPIFTAAVENRFYALAWSKPFSGRPHGLLAGAFENGVIEFWDTEILIKSKDLAAASVHKSSKHTGRVRSLQFSPLEPHILVTGGANGQIFIWDTKTFAEPTTPGTAMSAMDEISCVAWNNSVSHILATTAGGYTSIWDLKHKKEVLHLAYTGEKGKASFSYVAWHPTINTKLITASDNDSCPVIMTWDLRNSHAPDKVMDAHTSGVLSLDWCKQDPNLLLSSGKDNNTFLWNPLEGIKLGEYPTTANWAFLTQFAPSAPDVFATASYDGKIVIQSLQDTSPPISTQVKSGDDNSFWNDLSTTETQQATFEVRQAPIWLKRPSSVSFGFGSKLVAIRSENGKSVVTISKVSSGQESKNFTDAISTDDFSSIIEGKLAKFVTEADKSDWEVLQKLSVKGRDEIFKSEIKDAAKKVDAKVEAKPKKKGGAKKLEKTTSSEEKEEKEEKADKSEAVETKEDAKIEPASSASDDAFFEKLGNGFIDEPKGFTPSGDFTLDTEPLTHLLLANKIDEAVSSCLEQGKLLEALILALDSSITIKKKVKDAYFSKNTSNLSRILYSVSSKNISDIVSNADVSNWKQIASSIVAYSSDPSDFNTKVNQLGDRILESGKTKENRNNAITCYLAGNALDKIANIWLSELAPFEAELLKSDDKTITSPSDARLASLTNFVEKIAAYRSLSKQDGVLTGSSIESVSKAVLEYTTLVAGNGEFALAERFLSILPSEFAGSEKERILKAGLRPVQKTTAVATSKVSNGAKSSATGGAYGRSSKPSYSGASGVPQPNIYGGAQAANQFPIQQQLAGTNYGAPGNPYGQQPGNPYGQHSAGPYGQQAGQYSAPSVPTPYGAAQSFGNPNQFGAPLPPPGPAKAFTPATFVPGPGIPSAPIPAQNNPYAKANPYAPQGNGLANGSNGLTPPTPLSPPPKPSYKDNTDGWNDLPETFKPKPVRRATAAATNPIQAASGIPNAYAPKKVQQPPTTSTPPPPPKGPSSRISSASVPTVASVASPQLNRYAPVAVPVAEVTPPTHPGSGFRTQSYGSAPPSAPPKNPYAPNETTLTASPGLPKPAPAQILSPPSFGSSQSKPVKNPYAPAPGTPQAFGVAQPPQFQQFASPQQFQSPQQSLQPPPPPPPQRYSVNSPPVQPAYAPPPAAGPAPAAAPVAEPATKYPSGDRSHLTAETAPIVDGFSSILAAIEPQVPEKFLRHVTDTRLRLNYLFDHLNNSELVTSPTIALLSNIIAAISAKDFATAAATNLTILTEHSSEIGMWHVGVKRLVTLAESYY